MENNNLPCRDERDINFYIEEAKESMGGPVLEIGFNAGEIGFRIAKWPLAIPVVILECSKDMAAISRRRREELITPSRRIAVLDGKMEQFRILTLPHWDTSPRTTPGSAAQENINCTVYNFLASGIDGEKSGEILEVKSENLIFQQGLRWSLLEKNLWYTPFHATLEMAFPLIIIPFGGFQRLLSVEDQRNCLDDCRRHLTDRGRLIFDIPELEHKLPPREVVARHKIEKRLQSCGFKVEKLYGDFDRRPFWVGTKQIWVVSKK